MKILRPYKNNWKEAMKKKYTKKCGNCGKSFKTASQFRSVCPSCSAKSYGKLGIY